MLVYDVTNEVSFNKLEEWREAFITQAGLSDAATYPFMIIGNKIDDEKGRVVRVWPRSMLLSLLLFFAPLHRLIKRSRSGREAQGREVVPRARQPALL